MGAGERGAPGGGRRGRGAGRASGGRVPGLGPGVRLREVSYFLCLPGQAVEPGAANPVEVSAAEGGLGRWGSGGPASAGHF